MVLGHIFRRKQLRLSRDELIQDSETHTKLEIQYTLLLK